MASDSTATASLEQAIAAGAVGFGVLATLLPRAFGAIYGLGSDPNTVGMTRLWGTATTALGSLWFVSSDRPARRNLMTVAAGLNTANSLLILRDGNLSARTRLLGVVSSAGFAAATGYALSQG